MSKAQAARVGIRRAMMLAIAFLALVITVTSATTSPTVEAGKAGGSTAATLTVKAAPSGGLNVIVSGTGFSAGKKVRIDTHGPSPAPLRDVVVSSSGTFSYEYALPGKGTWTFSAYEEAKGGWKLKTSVVYLQR